MWMLHTFKFRVFLHICHTKLRGSQKTAATTTISIVATNCTIIKYTANRCAMCRQERIKEK